MLLGFMLCLARKIRDRLLEAVALQGVTRLDVRAELSIAPGMPLTMEDVPFDRDTGEVLYLPKPAEIRQFPALTVKVTLLAVEPDGMRELANYAFHHQPWPGGAQQPL